MDTRYKATTFHRFVDLFFRVRRNAAGYYIKYILHEGQFLSIDISNFANDTVI